MTPVSSTPAASASSIACMPGNAGSREGWTFTIRPGKRARNGFVSSCMNPARTTSSTAVLLEPARHHEVALLAALVAVERERGGGYPGASCTNRERKRRSGWRRQPRPAGLRRSAPAGSFPARRRGRRSRDPPDHELAGCAGSATTAHQPIPRLKTRRSSSSGDVPREPVEDRRPRPRAPVDLRRQALGEHPFQVAEDAAAGDVGERLRPAAQGAGLLEVEPASGRAGRGRRSPRSRARAGRA